MYIRSQGTINITGSSLTIGVTQKIINILNKSDVTIRDCKLYPVGNDVSAVGIFFGEGSGLTAAESSLAILGDTYIFRYD